MEGIRTLVQLNPTEFTNEEEVLAALPQLLQEWESLPATGIRPEIKATNTLRVEGGHAIRQLKFAIVNDSGNRISEINGLLSLPAGIFKHWTHHYALEEESSSDSRYRRFRF